MLTEFCDQLSDAQSIRTQFVPGIEVSRFSYAPSEEGEVAALVPSLEPFHFEVFYCYSGMLTLSRSRDRHLTVRGQEIFLVDDATSILEAHIEGPLEGVLVTVNTLIGQENLQNLFGMIGSMRIDMRLLKQRMEEHEGCALLQKSLWIGSVFSILAELTREEQGSFCLWKSVELLFLLCNHSHLLEPVTPNVKPHDQLSLIIVEIGIYMKQHLDEPLTIASLSRQFGISQTALKTEFRRLYGKPVRSWLVQQRMVRAAYLLDHTAMTVTRIAQECGYSSTSQFNTIFKRFYRCTPSQYRKMSDSV
ncbi:MAG: AraC family transcriptional regulator [Peptococcaceae bacterium]|nr:AraC family transcriptional regulator [Peptococcaceae bacterium]